MIYVSFDESDCALSSVQEVNAEEFEDKEWTFVIEGVCIIYFIIHVYVYLFIYQSTLLHWESMYMRRTLHKCCIASVSLKAATHTMRLQNVTAKKKIKIIQQTMTQQNTLDRSTQIDAINTTAQ